MVLAIAQMDTAHCVVLLVPARHHLVPKLPEEATANVGT